MKVRKMKNIKDYRMIEWKDEKMHDQKTLIKDEKKNEPNCVKKIMNEKRESNKEKKQTNKYPGKEINRCWKNKRLCWSKRNKIM